EGYKIFVEWNREQEAYYRSRRQMRAQREQEYALSVATRVRKRYSRRRHGRAAPPLKAQVPTRVVHISSFRRTLGGTMNAKIVFVTLAGISLALAGCGSTPQRLIIGKWEAGQTGTKVTAEFKEDGKVTLEMLGQTVQGTYKLNGGGELEWTVN